MFKKTVKRVRTWLAQLWNETKPEQAILPDSPVLVNFNASPSIGSPAGGYQSIAQPTMMDNPSGMTAIQKDAPSFYGYGSAPVNAPVKPFGEVGVSGAYISNGYVFEEFLPELQDVRGRKTMREMADNDDAVGAAVFAIENILKSTKWHTQAAEKDTTGEYHDFADSLLQDMEHTWADFISDALSMNIFGFSFFEMVLKRRVGPYEKDPSRRSKFSDGKIGIRKLSGRAQESLQRWEIAENGDILGMWQQPPTGGGTYFIPSSKAVHFRTTAKKNNPEGRSLLRNAYLPWYYKKNIQFYEATGIERELAGVPLIKIPGRFFTSTDPNDQMVLAAYKKVARDLRFNEQGGLVIPSDPWRDADGKMSNMPLIDVELISSSGGRAIDTNNVINRYSTAIVRSVLAEFLMLGDGAGSHALSKNKSEIFLKAIENLLGIIAEGMNRTVLPFVWKYNGFDPEMMPQFMPGSVAPVDLEEFGNFIEKIADAGFALAGDPETEKVVRTAAGLPAEVDPNLQPRNLTLPGLGDPNEDPLSSDSPSAKAA